MISDFVRVYAVGDVHIGAKECDLAGFEKFLKRIESEPDSYIVIVGDVLNNATRDSVTNVYEETMPPSAQVDLAAELLAPVAGKILGCVGGNHEQRSVKAVDLDPLFQVMTLLRIPELYRQNFAFVRVILQRGKNTRDYYALFMTHGKSSAKQRKFAQAAVEGVDAVIAGHTHNGLVEKNARLVLNHRNQVSVKPVVSLTATSWLGYGGYAARSQFVPSATSDPQALLLDFTGTNGKAGQISVVW